MEFCAGISVGIIIGVILIKILSRKDIHGDLIIDKDEDSTVLYLELKESPNYLSNGEKVIFQVRRLDSQN